MGVARPCFGLMMTFYFDAVRLPRLISGLIELRLLCKIGAAPNVERQQGGGTGAHGVRFAAHVMNHRSGRPLMPFPAPLLPSRRAAQRQIKLFGLVVMTRIVGGWTQEQESAGNVLARHKTVHSQDLGPSVIVEKSI